MVVVARDGGGRALATVRMNHSFFLDPFMVEAMSVLQVVIFGLHLAFSKVILEGESLQSIQALSKKDEGKWTNTGMV